jgi:hypothetical protein
MRGGAEPDRPTRRRATVAVALLAAAVQAPFFARGLSPLDEGSVLAIADALARGEALYRDRITVVAPLTYEGLALAFRAFGVHLGVARAFQALVFVACVLLVLAVLRRLAGERWALAGALALLALKPLAFQLWTMANYSQVGALALLGLLAALCAWPERRRGALLALAGLAGGLAFLAKQNLGALAAGAAGAALLADGWASAPRRVPRLARGAGLLLAGAALPVACAAAAYAAAGALPAAWSRAVVGVAALGSGAWDLPLPPLAPWSPDHPDAGLRIFSYFPASVVELALAGGLAMSTSWIAPALEAAVKLCYFAPLAAIAALFVCGLRARATAPLACALVAAGAWASMLYRADWAHLMNVWPMLHVAVVAALAQAGPRVRAALGALALAVWLGAGAVASWAFAALDWERVETPRGALAVPAPAAPSFASLLAWDAAQPPAARIAYLPWIPGLHFFTGRPLPLAADMLLPGVFAPGDDERLARELAGVDAVVWASAPLPWVGAGAVDVTPALAAALATQFRFTRRIAPGYFAFERAGAPPGGSPASSSLLGAGSEAPGVRAEHWLFHRVWASELEAGGRRCVEAPWRVADGDRVVASAMAHPSLWGAGSAAALDFELAAAEPGRSAALARRARLVPHTGPERLELALALPPGSDVVLRFCASLAPGAPGAPLAAGWGEPRVERAATPAGAARTP